jgi:hypothetical protein
MILSRLTTDEQKSSVHSIEFGSENAVKTMEAVGKYVIVIYMKALPVESCTRDPSVYTAVWSG